MIGGDKTTMVKIEVFSGQQYGTEDWPPPESVEFIAWFISKLDQIPSEYRDATIIDIDSNMVWDQALVTIEIYYYREKTEDEIASEDARLAQAAEVTRQKELATLAKLKDKYE